MSFLVVLVEKLAPENTWWFNHLPGPSISPKTPMSQTPGTNIAIAVGVGVAICSMSYAWNSADTLRGLHIYAGGPGLSLRLGKHPFVLPVVIL